MLNGEGGRRKGRRRGEGGRRRKGGEGREGGRVKEEGEGVKGEWTEGRRWVGGGRRGCYKPTIPSSPFSL